INQRLIDGARRGERVLRLKNGDPFVFGRGGEEALALAAAGIPFRVVPGITAGTAAPAYAGIPATHRTVAQSVAFVTGHGAGGQKTRVDWACLARSAETLVLYMARRRLPEIARLLLEAGRAGDEPVALLQEATTPREQREYLTLAEAARRDAIRGTSQPTLVVIGPTVSLGRSLESVLQNRPASVVISALRSVGGEAQ
ncbi:MAG: uroporphyrinogen-III C-methyltransferase, partial [Myxococcales bacterium]|nr:uroporphyrinogen-III C-methyltransferase [Myxococcales bacterium]